MDGWTSVPLEPKITVAPKLEASALCVSPGLQADWIKRQRKNNTRLNFALCRCDLDYIRTDR